MPPHSLEFVEELLSRARWIRFAILANESNRKELLFIETVARNRGGQVRVFDHEDEARRWLASSGSPADTRES